MLPIELSTTFAPDLSSAGEARRFVRGFLAASGASELSEVAALLTTELVTNAVLHTRSAPDVTARLAGRRLRVEVTDDDHTPPVRQRLAPRADRGRGMILVSNLAAAWGFEPTRTGKVVWFELDPGSPTERVQLGQR